MIPRVSSITQLFQTMEKAIRSFIASDSSTHIVKPLHEIVIHGESFFDVVYTATAPRLFEHKYYTETV